MDVLWCFPNCCFQATVKHWTCSCCCLVGRSSLYWLEASDSGSAHCHCCSHFLLASQNPRKLHFSCLLWMVFFSLILVDLAHICTFLVSFSFCCWRSWVFPYFPLAILNHHCHPFSPIYLYFVHCRQQRISRPSSELLVPPSSWDNPGLDSLSLLSPSIAVSLISIELSSKTMEVSESERFLYTHWWWNGLALFHQVSSMLAGTATSGFLYLSSMAWLAFILLILWVFSVLGSKVTFS